ncbi:hypothetical protein [Paraflavitalea speifideaquila]|uniref:hypothetical protein n=1 Tax=Paraflavitalea speifideaquila TaxID=3076558 RepID=UPI0028F0A383|nr:hypothetical protein [Paraflavitalea speifideiaquila]
MDEHFADFKPSLFSFEECLWFLNRNYDDCLHHIEPGRLVKAIAINGENIAFSLQEDGQHLVVECIHGGQEVASQQALMEYIRDWFDLERDIGPFTSCCKRIKRWAI